MNLQSFCKIHRFGFDDTSLSSRKHSPQKTHLKSTLDYWDPDEILDVPACSGWKIFGFTVVFPLRKVGMIWEPFGAGHLDIMKYLLDKKADPTAKASSVNGYCQGFTRKNIWIGTNKE